MGFILNVVDEMGSKAIFKARGKKAAASVRNTSTDQNHKTYKELIWVPSTKAPCELELDTDRNIS
ncbi:hypothetical protein LguiB_017989 [Lonicera macranthoides]